MSDATAAKIAASALALSASHPEVTALAILDLVMKGHHNTDPRFDPLPYPYLADHVERTPEEIADDIDLLDPECPFGRLLAAAFRTDGQIEVAVSWDDDVIQPFGQRYGLWARHDHLPRPYWVIRAYSWMVHNMITPDSACCDDYEIPAALTYDDPKYEGLTPETAAAAYCGRSFATTQVP